MLTAVASPTLTVPTGEALVEVSSSRVPSTWRMISVARSSSREPAVVRFMPRACRWEQVLSQLGFQLQDLVREGRLGHADLPGRARQAPGPDDRQEIAQLVECQRRSSPSYDAGPRQPEQRHALRPTREP